MHHFDYKNKRLFAEDVDLAALADRVGTPAYVYSTATLVRHYRVFSEAFAGQNALICFAVKANSNIAVLTTLAREGAGADVVSLGELKRALLAGIPGEHIVFSGVGKTAQEMRAGLEANIHQFNVESESELVLLSQIATGMERIAPIALRINPDVDAKTHAKISTGKAENKFGISWHQARTVYAKAARLPGIKVMGVDVHIGSQLTALEPFRLAFEKVVGLVAQLRSDGHEIKRVDLGGGLGIPYEPGQKLPPHPAQYGAMISELTGKIDAQIILEPGRLIAGNAGILLSRVLHVKDGDTRRFVILDAGMNDLIRPAMYDAYHDIIPVLQPESRETLRVDIVGPVCETGDVFAVGRNITPLESGDLVAFLSAGAYGAVMASTYNSRSLVPEVLVNGDEYAVIRDRMDLDAIIALDRLPEWLDNDA